MSNTSEQIRAALAHVDAHERETWVAMAMALKSELGEAGFPIWDDWSQTAKNYQATAARSVWKSIKPAGRVTISSLFALAIQQGYRPEQPYQAPSAEERARLDAERAAAQAEAEALAEQQRQQAKAKAGRLWERGHSISAEHGYLTRKGIVPAGAAQLRDMLLIPLRAGGELVNLQIVRPDSSKRFLTGGQVKGASLVLGKLRDAAQVLLCEGWATGCSLHQATGLPVVVAFNAHNLVTIAERLAATLPPAVEVIVCGDSDESLTGQQAAGRAAQVLQPRGRSVVPVFTVEQVEQHRQQHADKLPSDFNDLHQLASLEAVAAQVLTISTADAQQTQQGPTPADEDAYIQHLASLRPLEYGRLRKGAAEALGNVPLSLLDKLVATARRELATQEDDSAAGGCILFDEVEPWPTDVDGAAVLDAAHALLGRYVIADRETLRAAALWAAMTWFTDFATVLPLAVITAPEKGCGKSTLLTALSKLSCRPLYASNITPAALFRAVEKWRPTLMVDEADTFAKDNEELRGVLNAGHTRETATIVRVVEVGGELEPRAFSVWGAKALAGIGNLPETIMSRAVVLTMRRKMAGERSENLRHPDHEAFRLLKRQLARWADDMGETFAQARPDTSGLSNRTADNWEPLFALADLAGGDWPKLARQAAAKLTGGEEEATSVNEELLRDIRAAFDRRKTTKLWTTELINELCADDEAPWGSYNFRQGKPITARQLSKRLSEFDIKPKDIKEHFEVRKGYRIEDFTDAFSRYLDGGGFLSATPLPANNDGVFRVADSHFTNPVKSVSATSKPAPNKEGSGVADRNGGSGKDMQKEADDDFEIF